MKTITKKFSTKAIFLLLLIILFGVILRSFHLFSPLTELHDFRQIQTASIVWLYDKFGYNLFNYHVPMFGGKYWIHELPIYQTIIFFLTKVLGQHDYVGRLVSIGSYIIAGLSLFYISNKVLDKKRYSLLTILLYSILPLNIFFFRSYMIDPFTLSLALTTLALTIYSFTSLNIRKITLLFSFIFVGTLSKLTIFFPFILPIGYLFYSSFSRIPQKKERNSYF